MSAQTLNPTTLGKAAQPRWSLEVLLLGSLLAASDAFSAGPARDPGVRGGPPGAGAPIAGLTHYQLSYFQSGAADFAEIEAVEDGLGPRFNGDGCVTCHSQPAMGGTSPAVNPLVALATHNGALNRVPSFITLNGPIREARFVRNPDGTPDGGVHQLYVITGRADAPGCNIAQVDFETQLANNNVVFRIPTPVFGAGLIEAIADRDILANAAANAAVKARLGIRGHANRLRASRGVGLSGRPNHSGNDGTVTRFGWKAQNKSLLIFSGEAYNVEQGITNEMFPNEIDETPGCQFTPAPNDQTEFEAGSPVETSAGPTRFTHFMRLLAPPTPAPDSYLPGIGEGRNLFSAIGCALCHTPSFTTATNSVPALSGQRVNLYSDLLLHDMGPGLADGVSQGNASGSEFRTAPLWGLGQRIFFLHDGRTADLAEAIRAHKSGGNARQPGSEANAVIDNYNALPETQKQYLLNFLRSL
jgi:CxxC motif-containing protein (DUF1111 family)